MIFIFLSIMRMIMGKLQRFGRIRQLHTIISKETIRPSSPTPPHLRTHNLSLLDQFAAHIHLPIVFFYPNHNKSSSNTLKNSLSQCLTQYYPFAGRFPGQHATHINCNDQGVDFIEASIDTRLDDFLLKKEKEEILDHLIPNGLDYSVHNNNTHLVEIQLNHFAGGGAAVAVSVSHKVADGFTRANFFNHWATVARGGSPINPTFISPSSISNTKKMPEFVLKDIEKVNYARKKFVFPNSKLNELKNKVNAIATNPINPTRVELVTSLLFKCSAHAATTKSGSSKPSNLFSTVNMRNKIIKNCPELAAGNISTLVIANMPDSGEIMLDEVIVKMRKGIMELQGIRDVEEAARDLLDRFAMLGGDHETRAYTCSSLCNFPLYELDFGWGKPVEIMIRFPDVNDNCVLLLDTPSRDGIEALVRLQKEEMAILEKDQALLAYVENI